MPMVRRSSEMAVKVIQAALSSFEAESGLAPLVVLLPRRVFDQYAREQAVLESVLPELAPSPKDPREWTDVRVVEHDREEIEVY